MTGDGLFVNTNKASGYALTIDNDGNNANRYGISVTAGANAGTGTTYYLNAFDGDGTNVGYLANVGGTFAVTDVSDARTKTNITDANLSGMDIINGLRVVDFNRVQNPNGEKITGFIAQEVQGTYAKAVTVGENGMLGVMKDAFIPVLVKAAQEQSAQTIVLQQQQYSTSLALSSVQSQLGALQQQTNNQSALNTNLNAASLNISGDTTLNNLTVTGTLTAANLTVTGTLTTANLQVTGKIITGGSQPATTVIGAAIGTTVQISGNDTAGEISFTPTQGSTGTTGEQISITFTSPFSAKPRVSLTPVSAAASEVRYFVQSTTNGFVISLSDPPVAGETYSFNYFVVQ